MRSRTVYPLLVGLALIPLLSGCGGASPEARARQTMTAIEGTRTPTPLEEDLTAVVEGTFTGIDRETRVMLTAEATLRVRTPVPSNASRLMVGNETN